MPSIRPTIALTGGYDEDGQHDMHYTDAGVSQSALMISIAPSKIPNTPAAILFFVGRVLSEVNSFLLES